MCMYTSLVERTPAAGRQAHFSAGVASASAMSWLVTCFHSPSYPCQSPSGGFWANTGVTLKQSSRIMAFIFLLQGNSPSFMLSCIRNVDLRRHQRLGKQGRPVGDDLIYLA